MFATQTPNQRIEGRDVRLINSRDSLSNSGRAVERRSLPGHYRTTQAGCVSSANERARVLIVAWRLYLDLKAEGTRLIYFLLIYDNVSGHVLRAPVRYDVLYRARALAGRT